MTKKIFFRKKKNNYKSSLPLKSKTTLNYTYSVLGVTQNSTNFSPEILVEILSLFKRSVALATNQISKANAILLLKKQRSYRSFRMRMGLPVRGQRTHTNAKTRRKRHVI